MPDGTEFDVIIIGAGQASVPLAQALTKAGKQVTIAERSEHLGGSCVNFGCTPTKAVIASAKLAYQARKASEFGIKLGAVEVDYQAVIERAKAIRNESRESNAKSISEMNGVTRLHGHARLDGREGDAFRVRVSDIPVLANQVVLSTGTRSALPPIEGLEAVGVITAENWLELTELPKHLLIVGGSYIGLEMAQVYRRLGSEVTVIEAGETVAEREDPDVAEAMQALLEAEGILFRIGVRAKRVTQGDGTLVLILDDGSEVRGSHLMIASGRQPNTDELGLETVGVKTDDAGFIEVDKRLASSVQGIWVAGDIRGGPMFTHSAYDDFETLASQLLGEGSRTKKRLVPYAMFIDPQLGRVGLSEEQAKEAGKNFRVATYDMKKNGRAREMGAREGFIKLIVDADSSEILGAAVLAAEGAEPVHVYIALMNAGAPYTVLGEAIHIHPTLSEAVKSVVKSLS